MCTGPRSQVAKQVHHPVAAKGANVPTKAEIRAAIPAHCFERSTVKSLAYVARDAALVAAIAYAAFTYLPADASMEWYHALGWLAYAAVEGTVVVSLWVLAHECGHGGFSDSKLVNDLVGFPLHSFLMVPYFSWQFSHAKHHSKTNHLLDGETHVPMSKHGFYKSGLNKIHDALGEDAFALLYLTYALVFGWPLYLLQNTTGARRTRDGEKTSKYTIDHFRPSSKLFPKGWATKIAASTAGILTVIAGLVYAATVFGAAKVFLLYVPAYVVCNMWVVLYTFMHHSSTTVPQFGEDEWTWVKGALSTIDRNYYGFDTLHHHIGTTHVVHHLFSDLPCYNAQEATKHVRAFLEPKGMYNFDDTYWLTALFKTVKTCHFVENVDGVQYYKTYKKEPKVAKAQ